jgi:hypothetical protein
LEQAGGVASYRSVGGTLLLALDGTDYFTSQAFQCEHGSTRQHANGKVTHCHTAPTPVPVRPGGDKAIPLAPEFVRPQDGADQQDGELNAAKRWLAGHGLEIAQREVTVLGDDLYCHEPFCREPHALGLEFIPVCKPDSPPTAYAWVDYLQRNGAVSTATRTRWTGRRREVDGRQVPPAAPEAASPALVQ